MLAVGHYKLMMEKNKSILLLHFQRLRPLRWSASGCIMLMGARSISREGYNVPGSNYGFRIRQNVIMPPRIDSECCPVIYPVLDLLQFFWNDLQLKIFDSVFSKNIPKNSIRPHTCLNSSIFHHNRLTHMVLTKNQEQIHANLSGKTQLRI